MLLWGKKSYYGEKSVIVEEKSVIVEEKSVIVEEKSVDVKFLSTNWYLCFVIVHFLLSGLIGCC